MDGKWIYGINPVMEALRASARHMTVYVSVTGKTDRIRDLVELAHQKGCQVRTVEKGFFGRFGSALHQGVCAVPGQQQQQRQQQQFEDVEDVLLRVSVQREPGLFVILDGITDPGNVGAILRSAEATGVSAVVFQSHRSAGITPTVVKTSSGASQYVPLCVVPNIKHAMRTLSDNNVLICGADSHTGVSLWETDLSSPVAFVFGSEGEGLRRTVKEHCDQLVKIPLYGKIDSLNVSVAAGVFLFECRRQRLKR
ncbi:MAG: 23S rRNA (guanosine(2251)-2'-O)-methyltransferase RlmB [Nitrospirae bacterium]|uniref:23S rRNA (guanosine(2251)-2'-O)-methyltransferase RlmB n=1 Tax=Candidatus Magnetobacterium casense TaxID=1455061 RepID=UPI00058F524D|nr:23S rRNA (guanosine(2251)-2'-O)-methyltransferase RlmB [Candidatus Magnetobacterium casensis]MBF0337430.1 23S rRNA (guanosine(2251)-2'-O)-methyltransferase RlmB [Nitrospirota bacterium]